MKKLLASLAVALSLGGCAHFDLGHLGGTIARDVSNVASVISGANVSPQAVVIAGNSVDALQDTATIYLRLPICKPHGTPVCRVTAATQPIKRTVLAMRMARNDFENWYAAHPNSAPPASLYDKVTAAAAALNDVITTYSIGAVVANIGR